MSFDKMPPQAYTKETLQEAFEWWSEQSEDLRNQIQDKDDLVGYYLRSNRSRKVAPPKEGFTRSAKESFSSELKGLAKDLDGFEGYQGGSPPSRTGAPKHSKPVFEPASQMQFPDLSKTLVPTPEEVKIPKPETVPVPKKTSEASLVQNQFFKLDAKSKAVVARVKDRLNLSSEEEALRVLIAMGESKIKSIF
jgi:hypothetical protein